MERLDLLARIGASGADGGITSPGLSAAEDEAHALVAGWCEDAGRRRERPRRQPLYARPSGPNTAARSGPAPTSTRCSGGRFDGALGSSPRSRRWQRWPATGPGHPLPSSPSAKRRGGGSATDASAAAVPAGTSSARTASSGQPGTRRRLSVAEALSAHSSPMPLPEGVLRCTEGAGPMLNTAEGAGSGDVARRDGQLHGDPCRSSIHGHAGTGMPMSERSDAFAACAELALRMRERAVEIPGAVATIGDVTSPAGAASKSHPASSSTTVDVRAPTGDRLDAAGSKDDHRGRGDQPLQPSMRILGGCSAPVELSRQFIRPRRAGRGPHPRQLGAPLRSRNGGASRHSMSSPRRGRHAPRRRSPVLAEALRHLL